MEEIKLSSTAGWMGAAGFCVCVSGLLRQDATRALNGAAAADASQ